MPLRNNLEARITKNGVGIFSKVLIPKDTVVIEFGGHILKSEDLPDNIIPENDYYLQIGQDKFIGPSGTHDDYINHSCVSNCFVIIVGNRALLMSMQQIMPNIQITFDYSLTSTEDNWKMECKCGSYDCRKIISSYRLLDEETRKKYEDMNIVPKYVKESVK